MPRYRRNSPPALAYSEDVTGDNAHQQADTFRRKPHDHWIDQDRLETNSRQTIHIGFIEPMAGRQVRKHHMDSDSQQSYPREYHHRV